MFPFPFRFNQTKKEIMPILDSKSPVTLPSADDTHCADCGREFKAEGFTAGYATLNSSKRKVCYACADSRQRGDLLDRSLPFVGYLSGGKITSWTGGKLMTVIMQRARWNNFARGYIVSIRAMDCHGKEWHGVGSGEGMCIRLRPCKG